MTRTDGGRRKQDRMGFDVDEIALSQLFEGMLGLNRRYERAFKIGLAALVSAFIIMGIFGYLLYHSGTIARTTRTTARQELARATQHVAYTSCLRQNEHRAVERDILRRSRTATRRFAGAGVIPPALVRKQLHELNRDIRALSDTNCKKIAALIPLR